MIKDVNGNKCDDNSPFLKYKGIYKFFLKRDKLKELINKSKLEEKQKDYLIESLNEKNYEIEDNDFYCVYVGQTKQSFKTRVLGNHIEGKRKSTLRKSLKVFGFDDNSLNDFFEKNDSEYLFKLEEIKSKDSIDFKELLEINNDKFHLLNLRDNGYYFKNDYFIKLLLKILELR